MLTKERTFNRVISGAWFQTAHFLRRLCYYGQWHIALAIREKGDACLGRNHFYVLHPPGDCSFADPFLFENEGRRFLFFEIYSRHERGVIACCELFEDGKWSQPSIVLRAPYHLSYPFIFRWLGEIYMIPETQDHGTIEVYRAAQFPDRWLLHEVLMENVAFVDSTLHNEGDKWWLFTGSRGARAKNVNQLHLFFSQSPLGPWQSHPLNPVVLGDDRARPAGRLFRYGDHLLRPGQDSSRLYGEAIWLNRIDVLSSTEYRETPMLRLEPDRQQNSSRTHSIDFDNRFRVQDGFRYVPRFWPRRSASGFNSFQTDAEPR
jgi:hypothetical protein